jgi:hypothetical protein
MYDPPSIDVSDFRLLRKLFSAMKKIATSKAGVVSLLKIERLPAEFVLPRRQFLKFLGASATGLGLQACGGGGAVSEGANGAGSAQPTVLLGVISKSDTLPVWSVIPALTFTVGVPASISIAQYVTSKSLGELRITLNAVSLPAGISYDSARQAFSYDGAGTLASTSGLVLYASALNSLSQVASNTFGINISNTFGAFQLTSTTGGANLPFTLGYACRKGDVRSGTYVTTSIPGLQVVAKNYWPDGSLKFATISGRATLQAGIAQTVTLGIGDQTTGTALTTNDLKATGVTAAVDASGFGTVAWSGVDWTAPFLSWISGPQMSSWIYRKPVGTDPHLVAWLEVRLYAGGAVEVLPWIENGYLNVAAPGNKNAAYGFTLGGTQRFSGTIDLPSHCRTVLTSGTVLSHWLGTPVNIVATHDKAYLQASRLVPAYRAKVSATAPAWASLTKTFSPLQQGNYSSEMGSAGYQSAIGLLPEWDVLYLASNDPRAYAGVIINAYGAGRFGIHYRDETTLRPLKFSSYPNLVVHGGNSTGIAGTGGSTRNTYTPAVSGTRPPTWDTAHHPSVGYTAYLLTGRFYFMEEVQFCATTIYLNTTDSIRMFSAGVIKSSSANTTRGAAWSIRTLAQAACVTPDNDVSLRDEFVGSMAANVDFYHAAYVAKPTNTQGIVEPYVNYATGSGTYTTAAWMEDFFTAATGYAIDLELPMPAASKTKLAAFFAWKAQSIIGRLGGVGTNEYLYCDAATYTMAIAPTDTPDFATGTGPWYASWGAVYKATNGVNNPGVGGALRGGYFPEPTSYWGNLQPAIAYAVQHNVPGAQAAYTRMVTAPNWGEIVSGFNNAPVWSVMPDPAAVRVAPVAVLPSWVPPPGFFADVPMLNNPQDVTPAIYKIGGANDSFYMNNPFAIWGGSAILRDYSPLGAQVYYSGGHESSPALPNVQFSLICDFSTLLWSTANVPVAANLASSFVNGFSSDGTPYCPHTYLGLQEVPAAWGGGPKGSMASFFWGGSSIENKINLLDVSRSNHGYSVLATRQPQNVDPTKIRFSSNSIGGNYPITVIDHARQGWWAMVNGSIDFLLFVSKTGTITQYPALGGNLANGSMALCNSLNLLVTIDGGYTVGPYAQNGFRTLHIRDLTTGTVTKNVTVGIVPSLTAGYDGGTANYHRPDAMGLQWVDELGCIVGLDETTVPPTVVKLTPPSANAATTPWAWSTVTSLQHWPQDVGGQAELQKVENAVWSKFRWVPSLQAFVYGSAKNRKPQIIRLV